MLPEDAHADHCGKCTTVASGHTVYTVVYGKAKARHRQSNEETCIREKTAEIWHAVFDISLLVPKVKSQCLLILQVFPKLHSCNQNPSLGLCVNGFTARTVVEPELDHGHKSIQVLSIRNQVWARH